ncbi:tRNA 2-selenouridine(34) synthase MnmH [Hydrogenobacter hydrogenophilus]|uniref:tRNA 2-selenouridine synthase n=1 Tax=Hydrogenobacter hydrogenophilus TaxID=35835 RepID=A0A285NZ62_9AQUI|nr:tRNA 2-selenouridine(34) synthase MnmH [Hydrogenobacter hydrogenophilus]SNZ14317.1 tRNA 2-selenouridine synthase [Hydrogenobacter hydrogenophilus]
MVEISACELINLDEKVIVDIRSPSEYAQFHIPGAINIPLFEDDEKFLIGYIYRKEGVEKAKQLGYSIANSKLQKLFESFRQLKRVHKHVVVYCWRGGLRSLELCKALSSVGIQVIRLRGGYRAYREFILQDMEERLKSINFIVLTGKTGVGKSKVLRLLREEGVPVIDLEDLAQDRGSVFGKVGKKTRISQKMFDALLYENIRSLSGPYAFVEDESRCIGNIHIPDALWKKKEEGVFVELTNSMENRIRNILEEYTLEEGWEEDVRVALGKIKRYLGEEGFAQALCMLEERRYEELVKFLMEAHYDKRYKLIRKPLYTVDCTDLQKCKDELLKIFNTHSKTCLSSSPK